MSHIPVLERAYESENIHSYIQVCHKTTKLQTIIYTVDLVQTCVGPIHESSDSVSSYAPWLVDSEGFFSYYFAKTCSRIIGVEILMLEWMDGLVKGIQ